VKLLHTGDWHVGKALRGRSRLEEFADALREVVDQVGGCRDILVRLALENPLHLLVTGQEILFTRGEVEKRVTPVKNNGAQHRQDPIPWICEATVSVLRRIGSGPVYVQRSRV
jgi:hypothetical protein